MRHLLLTSAVITTFLGPECVHAGDDKKPKRPNILFIYTDDHSYRTLSCYPEALSLGEDAEHRSARQDGDSLHRRLQRLVVRPVAGHRSSPGMHPFGVQSMTFKGQYPSSSYDPAAVPLLAGGLSPARLLSRGRSANGTPAPTPASAATGTTRPCGIDPSIPDNAPNYYKKQLISFNGAKDEARRGLLRPTTTPTGPSISSTARHRDKDKPWFLWLCYGAIHGPFTPAERHKDAYPGVKVEVPKDIFAPRAGKPAYVQKMDVWAKGKNGEPVYKGKGDYQDKEGMTLTDGVRQYNQCVLAIDEGVGRLLQGARGIGPAREHADRVHVRPGLRLGPARLPPQARARTTPRSARRSSSPCPARLPQGKTCTGAGQRRRFRPDVLQVAGFELPWKMHGRDLTPLLKDPGKSWDEPMLVTHTGRSFGKDTNDPSQDGPARRRAVVGGARGRARPSTSARWSRTRSRSCTTWKATRRS